MGYFFKLPVITDLTIAQQAVLNETKAIAVTGGPGTGKSVVSLWRHIRNYETGSKESLLLTFTKTLEKYLSASATSENVSSGKAVDRTYRWITSGMKEYDEIIVDEAQDVGPSNYEILKQYSEIVSYGADNQQILFRETATTQEELAIIFPFNESYVLDENFRNSYQILLFVKALFPQKLIQQSTLTNLLQEGRIGNKPILLIAQNNETKKVKAIIDIINEFNTPTHNIAILVPLQSNVKEITKLIRNAGIQCSSFSSNDGKINAIENVHITTFKSSKGTEFDTVILPNFDKMQYNLKNYDVVKENDYYVALTRAKRNLYLICNLTPTFLEMSEPQKATYSKEIL